MTGPDDRTTEAKRTRAEARRVIAEDRRVGRKTTGASLGEAVGVTERTGRRILEELSAEDRPDDGRPQLEAVNA